MGCKHSKQEKKRVAKLRNCRGGGRASSLESRANTGGVPTIQLESLNDEIAAVLSASNTKNDEHRRPELRHPVPLYPGLDGTVSDEFRPFRGQDYLAMRAQLLRCGELFEDPEFPMHEFDGWKPVHWLRPSEICEAMGWEQPKFFVNGASRFDVRQGRLGDCWFLAALTNLTMHPKLFDKVVPKEQRFDVAYKGIFHFRFFEHGDWYDVVIDDRLPCDEEGFHMYLTSSDQGEFWSPLLEKAYAKLYGGYQKIDGGFSGGALVNFTGGTNEKYDLSNPPPNLFAMMIRADSRGAMITANILTPNGEMKNLVGGHAYSITKVVKLNGKYQLIRVRNPWGNDKEWTGHWSDSCEKWNSISAAEKKRVGYMKKGNGEFFIEFGDFIRYFSTVCIHLLPPQELDEYGQRRFFEDRLFIPKKRPTKMFRLKPTKADEHNTKGIMSVLQKRECVLKEHRIGLWMWRVNSRNQVVTTRKPQYQLDLKYCRENTDRFYLEPGWYQITVRSDCATCEENVLVRIFTEK